MTTSFDIFKLNESFSGKLYSQLTFNYLTWTKDYPEIREYTSSHRIATTYQNSNGDPNGLVVELFIYINHSASKVYLYTGCFKKKEHVEMCNNVVTFYCNAAKL